MKVRCIDAKEQEDVLREGSIYDGELMYDNYFDEERWKIKGIKGARFKKHRFEEVKELTLEEVIVNIKDGEVWECTRKTARVKEIKKNGEGENSLIVFGFGCLTEDTRASIQGTDTFKLKRKEYTFEEAFKAYEEGKEIECCYGGQKLKKENEKDYYFNYDKEDYVPLSFDEAFFDITTIRSKWYIND